MKALFDLFPAIIFFATYYLTKKDFIFATGALVIATVLQLLFLWFRDRTIGKVPLYSAVLIVILGGLTIAVDDPTILQWKPTLLYWALAIVLIVTQIMGKNLTQKALSSMYEQSNLHLKGVPKKIWQRLNGLVITFLLLIGLANIIIARTYSLEVWVNFKLFGLTLLLLIFMITLTLSLTRYIEKPDSEKPDSDTHKPTKE